MAENLKSNTITNLDATPIVVGTTGEGASGHLKIQSDNLSPTLSAAIWSSYRLARFPTNAKIKHVWAYLTGLESNTATGAGIYDFNVAFSDSTTDGTPAVLQGTIPSNKFDGTAYALTATGYVTSYASTGTGNKMFGSSIAQLNSSAQNLEMTFKNTFIPSMREDDMWNILGFTTSQGLANDPGGFFDILVVVAAAASTAALGKIGVEVDYVL